MTTQIVMTMMTDLFRSGLPIVVPEEKRLFESEESLLGCRAVRRCGRYEAATE